MFSRIEWKMTESNEFNTINAITLRAVTDIFFFLLILKREEMNLT